MVAGPRFTRPLLAALNLLMNMKLRLILSAFILFILLLASHIGYRNYIHSQYESDVYFTYSGGCQHSVYILNLDKYEITGFFKQTWTIGGANQSQYNKVEGTIQRKDDIYIFDFNDGNPPAKVKRETNNRYVSVEEDYYYFDTCNSLEAKKFVETVLDNI